MKSNLFKVNLTLTSALKIPKSVLEKGIKVLSQGVIEEKVEKNENSF